MVGSLNTFAAMAPGGGRVIPIDDPHPTPDSFHPVWNGTAIGGYKVTCNTDNKPCDACDAVQVMINLTNFGSVVIFPIVSVVTLYGALQMLTSAGSEERFRSGKKTLTSGIIGMAIVLCSWLIINTFMHVIIGNPFDWSVITCHH